MHNLHTLHEILSIFPRAPCSTGQSEALLTTWKLAKWLRVTVSLLKRTYAQTCTDMHRHARTRTSVKQVRIQQEKSSSCFPNNCPGSPLKKKGCPDESGTCKCVCVRSVYICVCAVPGLGHNSFFSVRPLLICDAVHVSFLLTKLGPRLLPHN